MCCYLYLSLSPPRLSLYVWMLSCWVHICLYVYVFLMESSLEYYELSFWVSFYGLCFEIYFVWYEYCYLGFFSCSFGWNIFSNPSLSVCVGLLFWGGSLVGSTCGSCFLSHSNTLCLLIGALINLHLRLLLIGTYSLPFFSLCTLVPLLLSLFFFLFLK